MTDREFTDVMSSVRALLAAFKIEYSDWILVGPYAYKLNGYKVDYTRKHFHILIDREKLPWKINDFEGKSRELVPPLASNFGKKYYKFIEQTGYDFDFIIGTEQMVFYKRNILLFPVNEKDYIQVLKPTANVEVEDYLFKKFPPEKIVNLFNYFDSLISEETKKGTPDFIYKVKNFSKKYKNQTKHYQPGGYRSPREIEKLTSVKGSAAFPGNVKGRTLVIKEKDAPPAIEKGKIIVTTMSSPRLAKLISESIGLVTDEGGVTCHAAILARELRIPCIIGTKIATKVFKNGDLIELVAGEEIVRKV